MSLCQCNPVRTQYKQNYFSVISVSKVHLHQNVSGAFVDKGLTYRFMTVYCILSWRVRTPYGASLASTVLGSTPSLPLTLPLSHDTGVLPRSRWIHEGRIEVRPNKVLYPTCPYFVYLYFILFLKLVPQKDYSWERKQLKFYSLSVSRILSTLLCFNKVYEGVFGKIPMLVRSNVTNGLYI